MTRVVILQSNYIPWRGYFDLIRTADIFIYYDEVQYTRGDWRNRNKVVSESGERWITLPVLKAGNFGQSIADTRISDIRWTSKHWDNIRGTYKSAPQFKTWKPFFKEAYKALEGEESLIKINRYLIEAICKELEITTKFLCSSDLPDPGNKTQRLVNLCKAVGATRYLSGRAAQNYLDVQKFEDADIVVEWFNYPDYKSYPQLDGQYRVGVSIIDTLFNTDMDPFEPFTKK